MWIIPKSPTFHSARAMTGSGLDSGCFGPVFERSLWWRGKPSPAATWSRRWKQERWIRAPVWTELRTFPFDRFRGLVDVLSAGFPCQPFSVVGDRLGVDDDRHLWPVIHAGIAACRPGIVICENVDGIVTAGSPGYHSVLHHVLSDLESLGYRATAGCFSAAEVGAPHLRKRWFIVAVADSDDAGLEGHARHVDPSLGSVERTRRPTRPPCLQRRGVAQQILYANECEGFDDECVCPCGNDYGDCFAPGPTEDGWLLLDERWAVREWPAGCDERQHDHECGRTTQPGLGGEHHGAAAIVDRIHLLGNGVIPLVCAKAVSTLLKELMA